MYVKLDEQSIDALAKYFAGADNIQVKSRGVDVEFYEDLAPISQVLNAHRFFTIDQDSVYRVKPKVTTRDEVMFYAGNVTGMVFDQRGTRVRFSIEEGTKKIVGVELA